MIRRRNLLLYSALMIFITIVGLFLFEVATDKMLIFLDPSSHHIYFSKPSVKSNPPTVSSHNLTTTTNNLPVAQKSPPVISTLIAEPNPVNPNGKVFVDVSAVDAYGDRLSHSWTATTGWTISSGQQGFAHITVIAPNSYSATGIITVTVSNIYGKSVTGQTYVSTVTSPPYDCPKDGTDAIAFLKQHVEEGHWITIWIESCSTLQNWLRENANIILKNNEWKPLVSVMSPDTLRIVRNTLYALHGGIFDDNKLQDFFKSRPWYKPQKPALQIVLSPEEKNIAEWLLTLENQWSPPKDEIPYGDRILPIMQNERGISVKTYRLPNSNSDKEEDDSDFNYSEGISITFRSGKTIDFKEAKPISGETTHFGYSFMPKKQLIVICEYRIINGAEGSTLKKMWLLNYAGKKIVDSKLPGEAKQVIYEVSKNGKYYDKVPYACPNLTPFYSDILIDFADMGCCGAIWDVITTVDLNLNPIGSYDCDEEKCQDMQIIYGEKNLFFITDLNDDRKEIWQILRDGKLKPLSIIKQSYKWMPIKTEPGSSQAIMVGPEIEKQCSTPHVEGVINPLYYYSIRDFGEWLVIFGEGRGQITKRKKSGKPYISDTLIPFTEIIPKGLYITSDTAGIQISTLTSYPPL